MFSTTKQELSLECSNPALELLGPDFQVSSETKWHNLSLQTPAQRASYKAEKDADVHRCSLLLL